MSHKWCLIILLIYTISTDVISQTNVSGTITQNTTWTKEGSPYTITSIIGLPAGVTLTIKPGVIVKHTSYVGGAEMTLIGGVIKIEGDEKSKVQFQNIRLTISQTDLGSFAISNAEFSNSYIIFKEKLAGKLTSLNSTFERTSVYVDCDNGPSENTSIVEFERCIFKYSQLNTRGSNSGMRIFDSFLKGVQISNQSAIKTCTLEDCYISNGEIFDYQPVSVSLNSSTLTGSSISGLNVFMSDCQMEISKSIYSIGVSMYSGEIKNSIIKSNDLNKALVMVNVGSANFEKVHFEGGATGILINQTISQPISKATVTNCNFVNVSGYNIENRSSAEINAKLNYWGTSDEKIIKEKIYDYYDNINFGIVNYSEFKSTIGKRPPIIQWSNPDPIAKGTPLTEKELNATAETTGTFTYTPPLRTIYDVEGNYPLKVFFSPVDDVNYFSVSYSSVLSVVAKNDIVTGDIKALNQVSISPNPVGNFLMVYGLNEKNASFQIVCFDGRVIEVPFWFENSSYVLETQNIAPGFYILKIERGKTHFIRFFKI